MQPAATTQEKGGYMARVSVSKALVSLTLLVAALVPAAFGQNATDKMSGGVTESGGAVVAGATIDLTSIERGTASSLPTNDAGIYVFPSVPPGHYRITARSQGFKQAEVQDLLVEVGSRLEQNFQLEIGSVRESVLVETAEPLVNQVSSTVSFVGAGGPLQGR